MTKKQVLGRGLGSLIEANPVDVAGSSSINEIEIDKIYPNPDQPRRNFDEESLLELASSIQQLGVIQPIAVHKVETDKYIIIAGERRYRASQLAGLTSIPAYVRTLEDDAMMEMALIENIQREDLNPIEVALAYQNILTTHDITQEQLSERIGKKRATITNYIRLLKLPAEIQIGIKDKKIDMGHARALVAIENPSEQLKLYELMIHTGISVRKAEEIVRRLAHGETVEELATQNQATKTKKNITTTAQEFEVLKKHLSSFFNTNVQLTCNPKGRGRITIPFKTSEELEMLIEMFDRMRAGQR